jgi:hypothetical protein
VTQGDAAHGKPKRRRSRDSSAARPAPGARVEDVRAALRGANLIPETEVALKRGRVDLRAGSTAIELKVQGTAERVLRQLTMYAEDPEIDDLVLVTSSAKLRSMPAQINGKPLFVVFLPRL